MKKLYREYFQKSKVFLYPLLGIKKGVRFVPVQTYISWNSIYGKNKNKFLCLYATKNDKKFRIFKELYLHIHPLYEGYEKIDKELYLYIFDLSIYRKDLIKFRKGEYSKFRQKTKDIITKFFGDIGTIAEFVESYLYPELYYEDYSDILNIPIENLKDVTELCDKPDLNKENFKKELTTIELFK